MYPPSTVLPRACFLGLCLVWVACGAGSSLTDFDGDGAVDSVDCNPQDNTIYPGAPEDCNDSIDNDCDGWVDCADNDCSDPLCGDDDDSGSGDDDDSGSGNDDDSGSGDDDDSGSSAEHCANGFDDDADGLVDCADPDCASDPACVNNPGSSDPCCTPSSSMEVGACHNSAATAAMCNSGVFGQCCVGLSMWDQTCIDGYVQYGASCP